MKGITRRGVLTGTALAPLAAATVTKAARRRHLTFRTFGIAASKRTLRQNR